jgi:predicted Na+-dependent transporter
MLSAFSDIGISLLLPRQPGGALNRDGIAPVFCGSKKSLAKGAPLTAILFDQTKVPIIFHRQLQLIAGCGWRVVTRGSSTMKDRPGSRNSQRGGRL